MAEFVFQMIKARKSYGDRVILDDVTLSFLPGAKIGVVGPNGMGKSTLLKIMAGLETVTGRRSNQLSYGAICTSMKHKRIYYSITGPRRAARRVAPRQCQAHPLPLQAIATPAIPALPIPWWAVVWRGFDRYADRAAQA